MRNISTKTHGVIEYVLAILLWTAPNLFAFDHVGGPAVWIPRMVAILVIALSLLTNFELGVFKIISMRTHLVIDYLTSLLLAASPFIFHFNTFDGRVWIPHVVAGLAYLVVSLKTKKEPSYATDTRPAHT